jgi:hypothetical protein
MPHASGKQWSAISVLNPIVPQRDTAPVAGDEPLDKNNTSLYKVTTLLPGRTAANHLTCLRVKGGALSVRGGLMAMQYAPIDRVERDFVSAQLDELAYAHDGQPWPALKQALLDWHFRTVALARSEAWIPGLANSHDPAVEKLLERFYSHHMAAAIKRIRAENVELRRKLLELAPRGSGGAGPSARDRQPKPPMAPS